MESTPPRLEVHVEDNNEDELEPLLPKGVAATYPLQATPHSARKNITPRSFGSASLLRRSTRSVTDMSVLGKLKDWDYVKEHYPLLDADEVCKAAENLDSIVTISSQTGGVLSKGLRDTSLDHQYSEVMMFKRRAVGTATLLHFAIWFVAEFGVDADLVYAVLESLADPDEAFKPASYSAGPKRVFLSAQHIAAGLGQLEILKALTRHVSTESSELMQTSPEAYVTQWARITPAHSSLTGADYLDPRKESQFTNFYQAIHESSFAGYGDVTLWLLQQKADCTRNKDNITPLHFLAFIGIQGCLETNLGENVRGIIRALQETGRRAEHVTATANMHSFIPNAKSVTPLEVAVDDASRFPQDYLGLLAPCLAEGAHPMYFDDVKRIADVTPDGALNLVRTIADKGKRHQHILRRFRINAQLEGSTDILASIFYTAPAAASEMLELLEAEPDVEDTAHHSIPARTSMWGLLKNLPMRCSYQTDAISKDCLRMPYWEWKTRHNMDAISWHENFTPRPPRQARSGHIKNVKVVCCLLPNILDIDLLMAFAHCQKEHLAIMNKKIVQGTIICLWSNLIEWSWAVDVLYRLGDVWGYLCIGVVIPGDEARVSLAWTIIAGGALYNLCLTLSTFSAVVRKWQRTEDDTMASMWSPTSGWSLGFLVPMVLQSCISLAFAVDLSFHKGARGRLDDRLLAVCLLLACFRFIWTWRLSVTGSTIYTISATFFAGAVSQMLFITCMLLVSIILALMVLSRLHTVGLAVSAYRGFLFGDDHGFNDLGMDVGHKHTFGGDDGVLLLFSVLGAFFFNVIVLNIIIAIYGHEYEKNQINTPGQFMLGRADYCVKTVLACYLIPWKGKEFNRFLTAASIGLFTVSIILGASRAYKEVETYRVLPHFWHMWLSAVLFALGQLLLRVAMIQCDWFSPEGQDSDDHQRFLWICHGQQWQWHAAAVDSSIDERLKELPDKLEENMGEMSNRLEELDDKFVDLYNALQMPKTPSVSPNSSKTK